MSGNDFSKNKKTKNTAYILLSLVFGLGIFLVVQSRKMKEQQNLKIQFIEEKNALRDDLDDLIDEHDNLLEEYGDLNMQLVEQDSIIRSQITEIRNLIRTKTDLNAARDKINILKDISKRYLFQIDSLYTLNATLHNKNDSVMKVNRNINWKNYKLSKENQVLTDKVIKGSVLGISDVFIETLKYRNSGKEVATSRATKVMKIRVTFNLEDNPITPNGKKNISIRFIAPNGEYLPNQNIRDSLFLNSQMEFSISKEINYENQVLPLSIEYTRIDPLIHGVYSTEIYIDNLLTISTSFELD